MERIAGKHDGDGATELLLPPGEDEQRRTPPPPGKDQPAPPDGGHGEGVPHDLKRPHILGVIIAVLVFIGLLIALFVLGEIPKRAEEKKIDEQVKNRAASLDSVGVQKPIPSKPSRSILLPCDVHANQETALYPRANGYLKKLYVDIQSHVSAGQLLAEIDTPEVDAQLAQARANVQQDQANVTNAQANLHLAQLTVERYKKSQQNDPGSVSQQDVDEKQAAFDQAAAALRQAEASVTSAQASVQQYAVLQGYEKVYAPFEGVVTARNYDVGALLNPANTGANQQLFSVAQIDVLRVWVYVPQAESTQIKIGQKAALLFRNYPKQEFTGIIARSTNALSMNSRTMIYQIDYQNKNSDLFPGMYGQVRFDVYDAKPAMLIPTSALIFDAKGVQVATVQEGKIHFKKVNVGRDLGTQLEITDGLTLDDEVVSDPSPRFVEGLDVKVVDKDQQSTASQQGPPTTQGTTLPSEENGPNGPAGFSGAKAKS
jgi:RND family efflux transporter MFP subunit